MRTVSDSYNSIRKEIGSYYEWRVSCGEKVYTNAELFTLEILPALFDGSGPKIGCSYSAQCNITLMEKSENWPRMGKFQIDFRVSSEDNVRKSEYIKFGTFYTDQREEVTNGRLHLTAFDGMLLLEQYWTDKIPEADLPANWPVTSKVMGELLVQATGIELDERTELDDEIECWGLNTTATAREIWASIAAMHGGNLTLTPDGKIRIIPLVSGELNGRSAIADIAIAGLAVVGRITDSVTVEDNPLMVNSSVCTRLTTAPTLDPITSVILETEAGNQAVAGTAGYTINGKCNFADSSGVADYCLSKLGNYKYRPFEAESVILDPAAEVGDLVLIPGSLSQIISISWNMGKHPRANVSAPFEAEIDHEYKIDSPEAKTLKKALEATNTAERTLRSYIQQTEERIEQGVSDKYVTKTEEQDDYQTLSSQITETATSIRSEVSNTYTTVSYVNQEIQNLQNQIDNNITQFIGSDIPTLSNYPAEDWETDEERAKHIGNIYTVNQDGGDYAWYSYRFVENDGAYSWELITDTLAAQAIANAAQAQADADAAKQAARDARTAADNAQQAADEAQEAAEEAERNAAEDATAKAEAAKQAAIEAAEADATAKAAEAEANAKQAAAEDATAKANQVLAQANAYTDDKLTGFISGDYAKMIKSLQDRLDNKAETYYQETDPSVGWDSRAGIAIVGVSITDSSYDIHTGDLWYRTTDGTTWYWNGAKWVEQNVPDEVFDKIDGKAQIFVTQPVPPYAVGDLWAQGENGDILKCKNPKSVGEEYSEEDWELASKYTDDSALTRFVNAVYTPAIEAVQTELDGKIDTYFYGYVPTLTNAPASDWTTDDLKAKHADDLFYDTTTGYTYRFVKSGSTYSWERVKDSDITEAMSAASSAQDTADGKRRVFVTTPKTEQAYDEGDLWVNATYGTTYSNDLLRCKTAKAAGAAFSINHWELASKYTDDTAAETVAKDLADNYRTAEETTLEIASAIEQSESKIELMVSERYVSNDQLSEVSSTVTQLKDELSVEITTVQQSSDSHYEEITDYIRYKDGTVIVGKTDSQSSLRLRNDGVELRMGEEVTTFWNQNKQRSPKSLEVPLGGSFQLGDFIFQPRTSGNLSLMFVGD